MKYYDIHRAVFKSRPNRFIAVCEMDGTEHISHVKNTGRCRELLVPGCTVYLEKNGNPNRRTEYDLVAVMKGEELFNIDAAAPNKVFGQWLENGGLFDDTELIKPETVYKKSRFDFYVEHGGKKAFIEVKGVTLERNGVLLFPDAPTQRGVKHIYELCRAMDDGYESYLAFIIQTEKAEYFTPNRQTHPEFAHALEYAVRRGVKIICLSCKTAPDELTAAAYVPVRILEED